MYEKDGQPAEVALRNIIRVKLVWPGKRPYKTENFYEIMEKEAISVATKRKKNVATATNAKTTGGKRPQCKSAKKK
jgi:hypothetical protein